MARIIASDNLTGHAHAHTHAHTHTQQTCTHAHAAHTHAHAPRSHANPSRSSPPTDSRAHSQQHPSPSDASLLSTSPVAASHLLSAHSWHGAHSTYSTHSGQLPPSGSPTSKKGSVRGGPAASDLPIQQQHQQQHQQQQGEEQEELLHGTRGGYLCPSHSCSADFAASTAGQLGGGGGGGGGAGLRGQGRQRMCL